MISVNLHTYFAIYQNIVNIISYTIFLHQNYHMIDNQFILHVTLVSKPTYPEKFVYL